MALAETRSAPRRDHAKGETATGEPSLSASLAHLVTSSQDVVTRRIDLALLEAQELLWRSIERAALIVVGISLGVATWIVAAWALATFLFPENPQYRLVSLAALNGVGAIACVFLAIRMGGVSLSERPNVSRERDVPRS